MSRKLREMNLRRIRLGEYASRDDRFYADHVREGVWRVIDVSKPRTVEQVAISLAEARQWMYRRRVVRP